jgi:hypothetical protein
VSDSVTQGTPDTGSISSMNIMQNAQFQTSHYKMHYLMSSCDADAVSTAGSNAEQIKQQKMELLHAWPKAPLDQRRTNKKLLSRTTLKGHSGLQYGTEQDGV